ncbi:kinase domain protein [Methylocaldum marinum]|uniref:Kinase domain protein n=1 Tax=Methylocaldum marinum TaxID=1432792 RepID=A0A250KS76_9GAMM|nr:kinase domain protein [Methylocaldum marinum]
MIEPPSGFVLKGPAEFTGPSLIIGYSVVNTKHPSMTLTLTGVLIHPITHKSPDVVGC